MRTQIEHNGYCGTASGLLYLPPGVWAVGAQTDIAARTVTKELADYLVDIELARVVQAEPEPEIVNANAAFAAFAAHLLLRPEELTEEQRRQALLWYSQLDEEGKQATGQDEPVAAEPPKAKAKRGTVK